MLIILCGLPGSGKTTVGKHWQEQIPDSVRVVSDDIRHAFYKNPTYSGEESSRVFQIAHEQTRALLNKRCVVIFDATNINDRAREPLYKIAEGCGVPYVVVVVKAPEDVIKQRLDDRRLLNTSGSDADWSIYQKMAPNFRIPTMYHYVVDTTESYAVITHEIMSLAQSFKKEQYFY